MAAVKPAVKPADAKPVDAKPVAKPADAKAFDFTALTVKPAAELPKLARKSGVRTPKVNPMAAIVQKSVDAGYKPMDLDPIPDNMVSKVKNFMYRAARDGNYGIDIRPRANGDGTTTITFTTKAERKGRKYTAQDVRDWCDAQAADGKPVNGYIAGKRIPAAVAKLYRTAHNIK